MKTGAAVATGFTPMLMAILAVSFRPLGTILLLPVYLLAVGCSFIGGFSVADRVTNSPGKNLLLGFAISAVFLATNLAALMLVSAVGTDPYPEP